jgi:hypothetical protein
LSKGKDGTIDLDTLIALVGCPFENRAAKATALEEASTDQSSIKNYLVDVLSNLLIHDKKADEMWVTLLQK